MTELVKCNTQLHKTLQGLWSDALTQHKLQQQALCVVSPTVFVSFPLCLLSSCVYILQWIGNFPPSLIPSTAG